MATDLPWRKNPARRVERVALSGPPHREYNPCEPMLKRIRRLRISLAAKCQLLFGAAVALIIAAALFVPWQRMEQLTEQINERSARALCDDALVDHLSGFPTNLRPTTLPAVPPPGSSSARAAA